MSDLNQCAFTGRLGRDPELRYIGNGDKAVTNFSIAVSERYKDRDGEQQERTLWLGCVVWGKLAEICNQYLRKGTQVAVGGKLQVREYEDKEGQKRTATELVVASMTMLGGKREDDERPAAKPAGRAQPRQAPPADLPFDDDIPF